MCKESSSTKPPRLKSILLMIALAIVAQVQGQSNFIYQAVTTTGIIGDIEFQMGATTKTADGSPGFEINFWALPFYGGSTNK